jgi:hypothetical protein
LTDHPPLAYDRSIIGVLLKVDMVIVETSLFTRQVQKLLSDEEYRHLQSDLTNRPDMGSIIPIHE